MAEDRLFAHIERLQGNAPWGSVLDAGAGRHSLSWIAGLATRCWTAVTADAGRARRLEEELGARRRPDDRILAGDWRDPLLLHGERFDVVIADYLLGAIDSVAPYFQDRLFARLRPHVASRLYVVGLEPYPESPGSAAGRAVLEVARLRDACILLAGHRSNREYPLEWTIRHLEGAGFTVEEARSFPIVYGRRFLEGQLEVCLEKLPWLEDRRLAGALKKHIAQVRRRVLELCEVQGGLAFGEDWVVLARAGATA